MKRLISGKLKTQLATSKVLLLMGPKGLGKNELVKELLPEGLDFLELDASVKKTQKELENPTKDSLRLLFEDKPFVLIREAQKCVHLQQLIEEILFNDWPVNLVLSCSYEPVLDEVLRDALRMQGLEIQIHPLLFQEVANDQGVVAFDKDLPHHLVYGAYPAVIKNPENAENYLLELVQTAIFTQLNPAERINKGDKLLKMLQILAFEMGNPISYNDIAFRVGLDNETVERYIDLFQKAFILLKVPSFYNGNKYELKKTHIVYFLDNGIRNAIIRNFNELDLRNDVDALWRNWLIAEKMKWNYAQGIEASYYFWRTHTKQSMDFIEVQADKISVYKSIWDKRKKPKFPKSFVEAYPNIQTYALNRASYWGFLSMK